MTERWHCHLISTIGGVFLLAHTEVSRRIACVFSRPWRSRIGLHSGRFARFVLVGLSGVAVNTACLVFLHEAAGLEPVVAAAIATEAAILNNFLLNDRWTFRDCGSRAPWLRRAWCYNCVCLGGLLIAVLTLTALTYGFGTPYVLANLLGAAVATGWNYGVNYRFTWSR